MKKCRVFIMVLLIFILILVCENNEAVTNQDPSPNEVIDSEEHFPNIVFIEEGRCIEIPETLENALSKALTENQISEFTSEYEAEYHIFTENEKEIYIQNYDYRNILKDYRETIEAEGDMWFGFEDSSICMIRHPIGRGEYAYYEYFPAGVQEDFALVMRALGKNDEYYFVDWEGKVYVITTKRKENNQTGIATYCMQGDALYGWMMYQELTEDGSVLTKYYGYTTTGAKSFGSYWPDY